jgi:hypothetical protein
MKMNDDNLKHLPLEKQIEISENIERKDFSFSEMCEIIEELLPSIKERSLQRKKSGKPCQNLTEVEQMKRLVNF